MAVTINGKTYRNQQEQIYKNMDDIQELKDIIKPEYTTSATLTSSSTSVAIASTNAPAGTTEGWLMTQDGLKFKINGGDDTNLLLMFYADLKGPQGEEGPSGDPTTLIDDNSVSETKTWSSDKINGELALAGKTYYQHNVKVAFTAGGYSARFYCQIPNADNDEFTLSTLKDFLNDNEFTDTTLSYLANGEQDYQTKKIIGVCIYLTGGNYLLCVEFSNGTLSTLTDNTITITDKVRTL